MTGAILEKATARLQHGAMHGNFEMRKAKKGPSFFRGEKRDFSCGFRASHLSPPF
jgi:hypothetical protein